MESLQLTDINTKMADSAFFFTESELVDLEVFKTKTVISNEFEVFDLCKKYSVMLKC